MSEAQDAEKSQSIIAMGSPFTLTAAQMAKIARARDLGLSAQVAAKLIVGVDYNGEYAWMRAEQIRRTYVAETQDLDYHAAAVAIKRRLEADYTLLKPDDVLQHGDVYGDSRSMNFECVVGVDNNNEGAVRWGPGTTVTLRMLHYFPRRPIARVVRTENGIDLTQIIKPLSQRRRRITPHAKISG